MRSGGNLLGLLPSLAIAGPKLSTQRHGVGAQEQGDRSRPHGGSHPEYEGDRKRSATCHWKLGSRRLFYSNLSIGKTVRWRFISRLRRDVNFVLTPISRLSVSIASIAMILTTGENAMKGLLRLTFKIRFRRIRRHARNSAQSENLPYLCAQSRSNLVDSFGLSRSGGRGAGPFDRMGPGAVRARRAAADGASRLWPAGRTGDEAADIRRSLA